MADTLPMCSLPSSLAAAVEVKLVLCRSCCREREVKTCSSSTLSQSLLSSFKSSVSIPSLPTRFSITKQLYTALVDCHLTNGCEIILDANPGLIRILEGVQIRFLRHMLGLSSNFVITPL
ncbi:uncharacterized protein C8R40DRAFT_670539 [Lentinula edodes]|uniref:uncharacterized protein n=1 Tax=Lentinula edodes TaxID=5353 RepID=UPI001E8DF4EB|nr:uncharacterized protein C8R40DRAFT_670539 [Lentinula edodes]KAH7869989.1 hypothetical protein C8R40DRAFT_670539 [Lentinula edodes]